MDEKKMAMFSNSEHCPVRNVIDHFGNKWSLLVLLLLHEAGVMRFNEIHKAIVTISQKMLSVTLKSLEADGLIVRKVYPVIPPKVEYNLTERGISLIPHLQSLVEWAGENQEGINQSRKHFKDQLNQSA